MEKASREKIQDFMKKPVEEGKTTRAVEQITAKIPSLGFMGLAVGSMIGSAALAMTSRKQLANFIGLWAPTLLIIGVYNKVVKVQNELEKQSSGKGSANRQTSDFQRQAAS